MNAARHFQPLRPTDIHMQLGDHWKRYPPDMKSWLPERKTGLSCLKIFSLDKTGTNGDLQRDPGLRVLLMKIQ